HRGVGLHVQAPIFNCDAFLRVAPRHQRSKSEKRPDTTVVHFGAGCNPVGAATEPDAAGVPLSALRNSNANRSRIAITAIAPRMPTRGEPLLNTLRDRCIVFLLPVSWPDTRAGLQIRCPFEMALGSPHVLGGGYPEGCLAARHVRSHPRYRSKRRG